MKPAAGPNACPFCGASPCLPLWRKLTLGPSASARCRTCTLKVTAEAGRAWLAMSPTIALVVLVTLRAITSPATLLSLLAACLIVTFALYLFWVRLVPNQITSAAMLETARQAAKPR